MSVSSSKLRILMLSTPVGPLGSGIVGGVEATLINLAKALQQRGHSVTLVAPQGSKCDAAKCIGISGSLQSPLQHHERDYQQIEGKDTVLSQMWAYAALVQSDYDVLFNMAYDVLPFTLTPEFSTTIAHFLSMSSQNTALDEAIEKVLTLYPGSVGVYSHAQAATYSFRDALQYLPAGIDTSLYTFVPTPTDALAWAGRIAPEKGLEDALHVAQATDRLLHVLGSIEDTDYFERIKQQYPKVNVHYHGFLPTAKVQSVIGRCQALLMTSHWVEAFGMVVLEALACGVPVIAYNRGGPAEIITHGETGWLIEPDQSNAWVTAVANLNQLSRAACRQRVETYYSLKAMSDQFEPWLVSIAQTKKNPTSETRGGDFGD